MCKTFLGSYLRKLSYGTFATEKYIAFKSIQTSGGSFLEKEWKIGPQSNFLMEVA